MPGLCEVLAFNHDSVLALTEVGGIAVAVSEFIHGNFSVTGAHNRQFDRKMFVLLGK